jgi:hypothetical protein
MADTVSGRVHVPSGAVLDLVGVPLDGVVVTGGGCAVISGTTRGLTVAVGGRAVLTGICLGPVVNDGGDLTIAGVVEGPVIEHAGRTVICPAAWIGGRHPAGP